VTSYRTIVADPPWRYSNARGTQTRSARGRRAVTAEDNYPTMTNEEIAALPVREWADDAAHLYLWVTNPRLYGGRGRKGDGAAIEPIDIMEAWGFEYVTCLTWVKLGAPGLGFYFRGMTEHVLFGVRGGLTIPTDARESNVITAPRGRHSEKPDRFYELVERVSPGPYLEMFARRRRYGWDVWGNEAPEEAASQAEMGLSA
jgi:N6-adenosine-specific RNA methylase IME4